MKKLLNRSSNFWKIMQYFWGSAILVFYALFALSLYVFDNDNFSLWSLIMSMFCGVICGFSKAVIDGRVRWIKYHQAEGRKDKFDD